MAAAPVETLRWSGERLELIDQRALPQRVQYIVCTRADEVADAIRSMVVRGAPAIGCAAAYGIALSALRAVASREPLAQSLPAAFDSLAASRPTAVNLFWALARMRRCWEGLATAPEAEIAAALVAQARAIHAEDIAANRVLGRLGAELLPQRCRVLTHCNAGALATAGYGTALGVVRAAVAAFRRRSPRYACPRPVLQGARLTAWEMQQEGIPVTLIADGAAGYLMSRGEIDAVIVGADRVAANGDVANKVGTYMVAVLAHRHGIPFYVACPVSTLDAAIATGADIPIEERPPMEVLGFKEATWAPDGVDVRNPAFDITPAELVSALVTERGVARAPYSHSIKKLIAPAADAATRPAAK
jgi:methylthioribose-1-phosphate isomerase